MTGEHRIEVWPTQFDPRPRTLSADQQLGTRAGWTWCPDCGGIQPPGHLCRFASSTRSPAHPEDGHHQPGCALLRVDPPHPSQSGSARDCTCGQKAEK